MNSGCTKFLIALVFPLLFNACKQEKPLVQKPNIIMIMVDQFRFDRLGIMGNKLLQTPNIDALANEGVLFKNAYCPSPVCAPSRAAVKTGLYPPSSGIVTNWVPFKEKVGQTTKIKTYLLPERLKNQGYQTGMVGKLHFYPADGNYGFSYKALNDAPYSVYSNDDKHSEYVSWLRQNSLGEDKPDIVQQFDDDENNYKAIGKPSVNTDSIYNFIMGSGWRTEEQHDITWTVQESMKFIAERSDEEPFFLYTSIFGPHQPYLAPSPWDTIYKPQDIELGPRFYAELNNSPIFQTSTSGGKLARQLRNNWSPDTYKEILAAYYGQISMIDHYLGKLFEQLKEQGLWENTWIFFLADHGDFNTAYGTFFKGHMYDVSAKIPFIIKPPATYKTKGVKEQLVNSIDLYGTILDIAGDNQWQALPQVASRSLLPLLNTDNGNTEWEDKVFSIIGNKPATNLCMLRSGAYKIIRKGVANDVAVYEFYDLGKDPLETQNVYKTESYRALGEKMRKELDAWWKEQSARYPSELDQSFKI